MGKGWSRVRVRVRVEVRKDQQQALRHWIGHRVVRI